MIDKSAAIGGRALKGSNDIAKIIDSIGEAVVGAVGTRRSTEINERAVTQQRCSRRKAFSGDLAGIVDRVGKKGRATGRQITHGTILKNKAAVGTTHNLPLIID